MDPELEILETSFNSRIEQWISKQGLFFQFTHNTGSGSMFPKICGLLFRLLILIFIGLAIFWFYLTNRPNSQAFKLDVEQQIAKGLNASEVEISNISRDKGGLLTGEMLFSTLALSEAENSFFEDWYVQEEDVSLVGRRSVVEMKKTATLLGVHLSPLGIGDNYFSGWSGKELKILKMELKLKTGADTDEQAMAAYSTLFKKYESLNIDAIQIFDATLHWGHSDISSGSIKGAQLNIVKGDDAWEINVTGGTFSHSWLKNVAITKMKIICKRTGEVDIESASLSLGEGDLKFNASIKIAAQPVVTGNYSFEDVEVRDLIGDSYDEWIDGNIDGTGVLSGNLNTVDGIKVTTTINLTGKSKLSFDKNDEQELTDGKQDSVIIIRGDNFHFLKVLQMKDPRNSYSLLRAHKGTLIVENQGEDTQVTVKDVRCGLNDLILAKGKFDYAIRTGKSKRKIIDAASLDLKENEVNPGLEPESEDVPGTVRSFTGGLELGLIPEVFEDNMKVLEAYPVDSATLRVWFNIELNGQIDELTEDLANKLYDIMKKGENN